MINLISIISFDGRSIKALLDEKRSVNFQCEYPIFYKMRSHSKNNEFGNRSAIDIAIDNKQIIALKLMLDYIVKY